MALPTFRICLGTYDMVIVVNKQFGITNFRVCLGTRGESCRCFLPNESRDPHPTCISCRSNNYGVSSPRNTCAMLGEDQWSAFHRVHEIISSGILKKGEHNLASNIARAMARDKFTLFSGFLQVSTLSLALSELSSDAISLTLLPLIFLSVIPLAHSLGSAEAGRDAWAN